MPLSALIIDDEYPCREALKDLVTRYCEQIATVYTVHNVEAGKKAIQETNPSIVFLDINMPDGSGFDLLTEIGNAYSFKVIFTTAYDDYAVKAFRYSAVDYLMKPINITELQEAVAKCASDQSAAGKIDAVQYYLKNQVYDKILVSTIEGSHFVDLADIVSIGADGNYSELMLKNGKKIIVSRNIGEFEEMLAANNFYRIHHGHIINLRYLISINKRDNEVVMKNGERLLISARKKSAFLKYCQQLGSAF